MKLQIVSDLHLEFAPIEIRNNTGADALVLSGDILIADYFTRGKDSPYYEWALQWKEWMYTLSMEFGKVFFSMGNHEHYYGKFHRTKQILEDAFSLYPNVHVLENEAMQWEGFTVFGGTMWGDLSGSPSARNEVARSMNDYRLIKGDDYRKLKLQSTVLQFFDFKAKLHQAASNGPTLVFSHHAPSYSSVTPEFYGSPLNMAYCSHMDKFIEDHPNIKLWTHGHVHSSHDYKIGETRIVANPRGYQRIHPENRNFNPDFTVEIEP